MLFHLFAKRRAIVLLAACSSLLAACGKSPETYEDCLLDKLSAGMDHSVGSAVVAACRSKFPAQVSAPPPLTPFGAEQMSKLSGKFLIGDDQWGSGNIYNGTDAWTVHQVQLVIGEPGSLRRGEAPKGKYEMYTVRVEVPPYSSRDFRVSVNWRREQPFEWQFANAIGSK